MVRYEVIILYEAKKGINATDASPTTHAPHEITEMKAHTRLGIRAYKLKMFSLQKEKVGSTQN